MLRLSIHHYICDHDKETNKMTEVGKMYLSCNAYLK